jgi:hypothetical protein
MLARIPFWGWLLIILTACYLVYNPLGFSVWHMWTTGSLMEALPFKLLGTLLLAALLGLVLHGTFSSTNWIGLIVMLSLVGATLWSAHALIQFDPLSLELWSWLTQPILAIILTMGWQWPKIWRRSTGAVSVNDPDTPA